ncbi:hemocytin-like [Panulirus ornatus]|uniref:hemocytin-like n=1 Tax=Panulirus ornatus TaxID=150431 RepID=UPI003A89650E
MSDDLCTTYACSRDEHRQVQIQAVRTECSKPSEEELKLYIFEEVTVPDQCCLAYVRVACVVNGTSVPVGKNIQDPHDSCTTISCLADADGNIVHREREIFCDTECELGSTYIEPPPTSQGCCGKCLKTNCAEDGKTYAVGERWENEDVCYEYSCETRNGILTTVVSKKECPYFDLECPEEETYMDELGCCKLCNITQPEKGK